MHENLKKTSIKAKKTLKNANFSLEVCLMELDQGKIINCVPDRIFLSTLKPFVCHNKNVLYVSHLLVSASKFGIDTTKIVGIVSVSYRFEKAGIAHPYWLVSFLKPGFHLS